MRIDFFDGIVNTVAADRKLTQVFYLLCLNIRQRTNKVITMEMLGRIRRMYVRDKLSLHETQRDVA